MSSIASYTIQLSLLEMKNDQISLEMYFLVNHGKFDAFILYSNVQKLPLRFSMHMDDGLQT